jgi:glycosyltransferase involved in cell wall biosynthesis
MKVTFISVVPSPYQRDIFRALAQRSEIDLQVYYMEAAAPDSPWPDKPLASYEQIMPGFWVPLGGMRSHVNYPLPRLRECDIVVLNTIVSATAQWLMRISLREKRWLFWGEKMREYHSGWQKRAHQALTAPLHGANGIVAIGTVADADYSNRFPAPRHFNIPYYCALLPFLDLQTKPVEKEITYMFCGQMIARKGIDYLLQAFERLVKSGLPVKLLMVGREAELPELLATMTPEARGRVEYAGFQAPEDLPSFFSQANVFVLPSRYDGWGVVVNQAIGAGLPILCSDAVGAGHDLIDEGVNGFRFKTGNADDLFAKMHYVASHPEKIGEWGAASRAKAVDWLPERGAEKWVRVLQAID